MLVLFKFPRDCTSERIFKIGEYLVKIKTRVWCLPFLTHGVVTSYDIAIVKVFSFS